MLIAIRLAIAGPFVSAAVLVHRQPTPIGLQVVEHGVTSHLDVTAKIDYLRTRDHMLQFSFLMTCEAWEFPSL